MARETHSISASQKVLKFANGTQLTVASFSGAATQWTNDTGSFRAFRLPAEEDTSLDLQKAMAELGIYEQETIHLDVSGSGQLRTFAGQPTADSIVIRPARTAAGEAAVKVVLYQDESGGVSWHFPDGFFETPAPAAATRSALRATPDAVFTIPTRTVAAREVVTGPREPSLMRGIITKWGRKIFKVFVIPVLAPLLEKPMELIVGKIEEKYRKDLIRPVTVENYRTADTPPFADWGSLDGQRSLLVIHGIFSTTHGMLSLLPKEAMTELSQLYQGRLIAYDHLTVTKDPEDNARHFLKTVKKLSQQGRFDFDILCHSRGGIVARTLVERGETLLPGHNCTFGKVYFAATPNQGSPLADPAHIVDMLDVFTNLLTNFPDGPALYSIEIFLSIVKLLAYTAERSLPGLASMGTKGYISQVLNRSDAPSPATYACCAANYDPDPRRDNSFFTGAFANAIIDRVFTKDGAAVLNDLVVPRDGVYAANGHPSFPIQEALVYENEAHVWHTGFFKERRTIDHIKKHFGVEMPTAAASPRDLEAASEYLLEHGPWGDRGERRQRGELLVQSHTRSVEAGDGEGGGGMPALPAAEVTPPPLAAESTEVAPVELQRRPAIDFHEQVREGEAQELVVRLDELSDAERAKMADVLTLALGAGESSVDVTVMLRAPGFRLGGPFFQTMTVRRERDRQTERAVFQLTAERPGPEPKLREITADFWVHNSIVGSVTHRTYVVPRDYQGDAPSDGSSTSAGFVLPNTRRTDCDFVIIVEGQEDSGQPPYRIRIRSDLPDYSYEGRAVGTLNVPGNDLAAFLDRFYQPHFSSFPVAGASVSEEQFTASLKAWEESFSDDLTKLGKQLWNFLPKSFRDEYFRMYQAGLLPRSIFIHSDEMIFPWELVVPYDTVQGKLVVLQPLGVTHILGRWKPSLLMKPIPQYLPVHNICVLNPRYAAPNELAWSLAEIKALRKLFRNLLVITPADLATVKSKVLNRSDIQIFHFSGHGQYDLQTPDLSQLLLENNDMLDPLDFPGTKLCNEGCPIVYLNACSVGSTGLVVGRMGGFAAKFLDNGCSGVIAPYWPINDARAAKFSVSLYQKLQQGRAIGEALQELRSENLTDPTFRAYSYFGDPWARVNFEPR